MGTGLLDLAKAITSDPSGNVYVTGYTGGSLNGNNNFGAKDLFIVKYDSGGVKQ